MGVDEVLMSQVMFWIPSGPTGSLDSQMENKVIPLEPPARLQVGFTFSSATTCSINQRHAKPGLVPVQDQDFKTCVNVKVLDQIM